MMKQVTETMKIFRAVKMTKTPAPTPMSTNILENCSCSVTAVLKIINNHHNSLTTTVTMIIAQAYNFNMCSYYAYRLNILVVLLVVAGGCDTIVTTVEVTLQTLEGVT